MNTPVRNPIPTRTLRGIAPALIDARGDKGIGSDRRHCMIAEVAYYSSERRGFEPGHKLDDWLAAEGQVDAALAVGEAPTLTGC